uniref:C-type lectin domain-containing protein n=1 Tax=Periophthalmus magnuspinnatus TaxID=409849 RepID=A0A3B4AHP7_9GOBI
MFNCWFWFLRSLIWLLRYWGPGEPSMNLENEDCVESRFFEVEHTWNDLKCEDINFWISNQPCPGG